MNKKVSELTEANQINDNDLFMTIQNNQNKKIKFNIIKNFFTKKIEESAVIVSATEPQTNEKVWFQKSNNLFNQELEQGGINNDGTNFESSTRIRTKGYIKIDEALDYIFNIYKTNNLDILVDIFVFKEKSASFNTPNTPLLETLWIKTPAKFKAPTSSNYCRVAFRKSNNANILPNEIGDIQLEKGLVGTNYEPYTPNKILTKSNGVFEEFYNEENKENYSTAEQRIGTWIDGKPLYQKTIIMNNLKLNAPNAHGIENINEIIDMKGVFLLKNGFTRPLSSIYITNNNIDVTYALSIYFVDKTNIEIRAGNNVEAIGVQQLKVTLQYTKTTD